MPCNSIPRLLPLLVLGCAAGAAPAALEITPWSPPRGQDCALSGGDFPPAAVLDSARLAAGIAEAAPADGALLVSVATDSTGAPSHIRRIETTLPAGAADAVEALLRGVLGAEPGERRHGRVLLELGRGRLARVAVGPSEHCRPAYADLREVRRALSRLGDRLTETTEAQVMMRVDTTGAVVEAHLRRATGVLELDRGLVEAARLARFHPARVDRRPVTVWVASPLTLEVMCAPADTAFALLDGFRCTPPRRPR